MSPRQVYHGALCSSCRERKATHPPGVCERCWKRLRYGDHSDGYRERVLAAKRRYAERQKAKRDAAREAAEASE